MVEFEAKIILAFAKCDMKVKPASEILYCNENTVRYHLPIIQEATGLDPRKFYDLVELVKIARESLGYESSFEKTDLEKAREHFKEKRRVLIDNFGMEKHPEKIEAVNIAIDLIEREIKNEKTY
jgi:hypothetical protein